MDNITNKFQILFMLFAGIVLFSCSDSIPGDDSAFDPIASLPDAFEFAESIDKVPDYFEDEEIYLYGITALYIKPDGTMDFKEEAYNPKCIYSFVKNIKPENTESNVPLGVNNSNSDNRQVVKVMEVIMRKPWDEDVVGQDGTMGTVHYRGVEKNYRIKSADEFNIPQTETPMSFKTIWQKAIEAGAPSENAVAVIRYYPETGYSFEIKHTDYEYWFDKNGDLKK